VDGYVGVAFFGENRRKLARTRLTRALGNTDEEVIASLADVSAVDRARRDDRMHRRIELRQRRGNAGDFALAARRTWPRQDCDEWCNDRGVFDERGVGKIRIRRQPCQGEVALLERRAVELMLMECQSDVGLAHRGA